MSNIFRKTSVLAATTEIHCKLTQDLCDVFNSNAKIWSCVIKKRITNLAVA